MEEMLPDIDPKQRKKDFNDYKYAVERAKETLEGEELEKCLIALHNWITYHERHNNGRN